MEEALPLGFIILLLCIVCGAVAVAIGIYVSSFTRLLIAFFLFRV